jgi:hypothetical protein
MSRKAPKDYLLNNYPMKPPILLLAHTARYKRSVYFFRNGAEENISMNWEANKVRNFYNNIADPLTNAVTIDTHAMAIANLMPFGPVLMRLS